MSDLLIALSIVLEILAVVGVVMLVRYLFNKAGIELTEHEWELVNKAITEAVQYAEQMALKYQKENNGKKMTSAEKLELAKSLADKLLDKFKLSHLKVFIVPLIEAKLTELLNKPEPK